VASAAADASAVADAQSIERFALMGHSGGGSHALACAALLPERVLGVVVVAGMAPFGAEGLDWFEGFGPAGVAQLRVAAAGRATTAYATRIAFRARLGGRVLTDLPPVTSASIHSTPWKRATLTR